MDPWVEFEIVMRFLGPKIGCSEKHSEKFLEKIHWENVILSPHRLDNVRYI